MLKLGRFTVVLFAAAGVAGESPRQSGHQIAPGASIQTASPCVSLPVASKCPMWVSTFNGEGNGGDTPGDNFLNSHVLATSPDGQTVYVAGATTNANQGVDYLVLAYESATGVLRWSFRYPNSPAGSVSAAYAIAVSPNSDRVFVTGTSDASGLLTIALSATTGEQLWLASKFVYGGPPDIAVSPDGTRVYVCGLGGFVDTDGEGRFKAVALAYDAVTGQTLWSQRDFGSPGGDTIARKIVASPDGNRVYVSAGGLNAGGYTIDLVLLVFESATGNLVNEAHHPTLGLLPAGIAVSPDSTHVFVTHVNSEAVVNNALTIAYDPSGNESWVARFSGVCSNGVSSCSAKPWYFAPIAVGPDSQTVFLTSGTTSEATRGFATVAYDTSNGTEKWVSRYDNSPLDVHSVVTPGPTGSEVYVSGASPAGAITVAYNASTGAQNWEALYPGGYSNSIAVTPDGTRLFTAGNIRGAFTQGSADDPADVFVVAHNTVTSPLPPSALQVIDVMSRKAHGPSGTFDIHFPNSGQPGIECRNGGANGDYSIILTFSSPLAAVGGASVDCGSVSNSMIGPGQNQYTVNLTGEDVCNGQYLTVATQNVVATDGNIGLFMLSSPIGLLMGDTNGDGSVNSADISQTKSQSGNAVTSSNFREDVTIDGNLNSADIGLLKSKSGTALP